jgi:hypothetical protein
MYAEERWDILKEGGGVCHCSSYALSQPPTICLELAHGTTMTQAKLLLFSFFCF